MGYERSVSADAHDLLPESVWHIQMPQIRFGRDSVRELGHQLSSLGADGDARGLLVTDENLESLGHVDRVVDHLEDDGFSVDVYADCEPEPTVQVADDCIDFVRENAGDDGYDFYVGLGGGSNMDIAKIARTVIANGGEPLDYIAEPTGGGKAIVDTGAPLVLMPTTAGTGSEISPVAILSVEEKNIKEGISDNKVRADAAVLDPTFTTTLPPDLTAKTAMDALGHAIEGYTTHEFDSLMRAQDPSERPVYAGRTPLTEMFSEKAIDLLSSNVRTAVHNGDDLEARSNMLQGALFGAIAGLTAGANLAHAIAYPVGNKYHTAHGETIAALTPASTIDYNSASDPGRFANVAEMFGISTKEMTDHAAADALKAEYIQLQKDLNVLPSGLNELAGITEDDVDWLAQQTVDTQERLLRCNPRPVEKEDVRDVLLDALHNWED